MLDQVPIERLVGTGVRVDVTTPCARNRDHRVTIQDLEQWEAAHARIPDQAIVLLDTGFARFWPSRQEYLGTELRGQEGVRALHFPGLHPEAAAWLVRERLVKAVGIDTASIDHPDDATYPAHHALLGANVPVIENVANLSALRSSAFWLLALPLNLQGTSGSPIRLVALAK